MNQDPNKMLADFQAAANDSIRGQLSDVSDDFGIFMREIESSIGLLPPTIGYLSGVMSDIEDVMQRWLQPEGDETLTRNTAPCIVGYEDGDALDGPKFFAFQDLILLAILSRARLYFLRKYRKMATVAAIFARITGPLHPQHPQPFLARAILDSIERMERVMGLLGVKVDGERLDIGGSKRILRDFLLRYENA